MYSFTVTVRDKPGYDNSLSDEKTFKILIRNNWDKPKCRILEPNNNAEFNREDSIQFRGLCIDEDLAVPQNNEKITFEWFSDIDGVLGAGELLHGIKLSPGENGQKHKITLKVSDGKFDDYADIDVIITKEKDGKSDDKEDQGPPNDSENEWFYPLLLFLVIIIVIVIFVILMRVSVNRKIQRSIEYSIKRRELVDKYKDPNLSIRSKLSKRRSIGGSYKPICKKVIAYCDKCGQLNKLSASAQKRPLVVKCSNCGSRGVIYN